MPQKPKSPCRYPGCPKLTDGRYCDEHQKLIDRNYNRYGRDPATGQRYGTAWRIIRCSYIAAHPLCEQCLKDGRMAPAQEVHHILPLSDGGTNDSSNLMALCKSCHSQITAEMGDRWHNKKRG